jgi:predicted esterase
MLTLGMSLFQGCSPAPAVDPQLYSQPTLSLDQTSSEPFGIKDFEAYHKPVDGDGNKALLFGNIAVQPPAADLPEELSSLLGRWEGYNFGPPIKKDTKVVMVISEITPTDGTAYAWSGSNFQFMDLASKYHFRVVRGEKTTIQCQSSAGGGQSSVISFTYDAGQDQLTGWVGAPGEAGSFGPMVLTRAETFFVYKDYPRYLESLGVTVHDYQNTVLTLYGRGYMLYLPEGYEENPDRDWPLIFFLHGSGDRGDNPYLLAKASPFMYIREQGPLEAIIAAPLFKSSPDPAFPMGYLDGALEEIRSEYRVDAQRIYLTGLSLGGQATWRFALHQPETFAAAAPLCAFLPDSNLPEMDAIKKLPVWAIHGADDTVIPPESGLKPVEALKAAGGNVKWSLLPDHDHDVWTDTYSDPAFYDWLLQNHRQ